MIEVGEIALTAQFLDQEGELAPVAPADYRIEIVSDDRAFDAVGDVATSLGIAFRRLSYRRLTEDAAEALAAVIAS